jgi:hypothetical protein
MTDIFGLLGAGAHAWLAFGHKPIWEAEIRREIERQAGSTDGSKGSKW